jgi:hypothetical protein
MTPLELKHYRKAFEDAANAIMGMEIPTRFKLLIDANLRQTFMDNVVPDVMPQDQRKHECLLCYRTFLATLEATSSPSAPSPLPANHGATLVVHHKQSLR